MSVEYKFVETSVVTDDSLERTVNEWVGKGWQLDGIHFVTSPTSKRPVMACRISHLCRAKGIGGVDRKNSRTRKSM